MENKLKAEKISMKIDFDFKKIFVHLAKAVAGFATLDISSGISEVVDIGSETFLNAPEKRMAYRLITKAMAKAVFTLIKELNNGDIFPMNVKKTEKQLSGSFKLMNLELTAAFSKNRKNPNP